MDEQVDPSARADLQPGRMLGDFVVREKLQEGGFGAVYRAEQRLLGREAVIKVLLASLQESGTQRFLREARLASKLDHPFAAHIYAFGFEDDGLLWIAMERVRGTPLNQLLKLQGPVPLHRFTSFFEKLCEVVHTAHSQNIIHRDLKPANVMVLSRAGKMLPKLLDLGIAKLSDSAESVSSEESSPVLVERSTGVPSANTEVVSSDTAQHGVGPVSDVTAQFDPTRSRTQQTAFDRAFAAELTHAASVMGSPHYMAPEQWVNASSADPRTDIYALSVLAYQCLTGRLPFDGTSMRELAKAHAKKPFPPLGAELPPSLDAVLAKAAAKRPADRFASALELAQAFRAASGLAEEELIVPQLPEDVRELYLHEAPQPIAEAVALLESARRPERAVKAVERVLVATARYVGVVALAARARVGPGTGQDAPEVLAALRKLAESELSPPEWWALARALVAPFRETREVHPLPELVTAFWPEEEGAANADASFHEVWSALQKQEELGELLRRLGRLLQNLFFLQEYRLRLRRGETAEQWTGMRRSARSIYPLGRQPPRDGEFFLAGAEGEVVLNLAPLVQAIAPTPGAALEPFFLEGQGRYGAKLAALPVSYERHDETVWQWLDSHVAPVTRGVAERAGGEDTPYLGLASFTAAQSQNFFGREREAEAFANRLRVRSLLAVVGPSGAGKSSFLQAGVLPLMPGCTATTVRPGPSPFVALAQKLAQEGILPVGITAEAAKEALEASPDQLGRWLQECAERRGQTLLLVVDQFEELVTLCPDPTERSRYALALVTAASGPPELPVRVVLAFRDDFLIRLQQLPALRERLSEGIQLLGTPAPDDLLRILTKPAERANYAFEDDELAEQMVKEVESLPGALALLSFTASKLWELRDRQLKRLTRRAYGALGGVGGALAHHAESTLAAMGEKDRPLVREAFRHLVTAEGTRAVLSRRELDQLLGGPANAGPLLEKLIVARLLVTSELGAAEDRVEVIHEALLSSWPRLVEWQREDAENLRMRDALRAAARQWIERGRPRGLLWRGEPLLEYKVWRLRYTGAVTDAEAAFAQASLRDEARGRNLRRGLLLGSFVVLLVVLAVVARSQQQATRSSAEASRRLAELREEQGRLAWLGNKPLEALVYLKTAFEAGVRGIGIQLLLNRAREVAGASKRSVVAHQGLILGLAVSPDQKSIVSGSVDRTAVIWSLTDGRKLHVLEGHRDAVMSLAFSADGQLLVTAARDGGLHLWNPNDGKSLGTLHGQTHLLSSMRLTPDGRYAFLGGVDERIEVVSVANRRSERMLTAVGKASYLVASPDGRWVGGSSGPSMDPSAVVPNEVTVFRTDTFERKVLKGLTGPPRLIAFDRGGRYVAAGGDDKTVRVWKLPEGNLIATLIGHTNVPSALAFSNDGRRLATGGADSTVRLWDLESAKPIAVMTGHVQSVRRVAFTPDGEGVFSAGEDGIARLWNAHNGDLLWEFVGHVEAISDLVVRPEGDTIITSGRDGLLKTWATDRRRFVPSLPKQAPLMGWLTTPDGSRILALTEGMRGVEEWDRAAAARRYTFEFRGKQFLGAGWSPKADQLMTLDEVGARLWQLPEGRLLWTLPPGEGEAAQLDNAELSQDGRRLAVLHSAGMKIDLWDLPGRKKLTTLESQGAAITAMAFSREAGFLAATTDGMVMAWHSEDGHLKWKLRGPVTSLFTVAASADGRFIAAGGADLAVTVWDAHALAQLAVLHGSQGTLVGIAFSSDGSLIAGSGSNPHVSIWETEHWKQVEDLQTTAPVRGLTFLPDNRLATLSYDGFVHEWDTRAPPVDVPALGKLARCSVPFRMVGESLVRSLESDPSCIDP